MISEDIKQLLKLLYYSSIGKEKQVYVGNITKYTELVNKNRLTTTLYYGLHLLENNDYSLDEISKIKNRSIAQGLLSFYQDLAFKTLVTRLAKENIEVIAFKGYVINNLYAKKEMRLMGDIDLIVDPKHYVKARKIMLDELGYSIVGEDGSELCAANKQGATIELHQHLVTELSNNQKYFDKTYRDHLIKNAEYYVFDVNYHFLYMMDHIYKHFMEGGLGLKYLYDFALYIDKYPNVIKDTIDDITKLGLDRITLSFLQICRDVLEISIDQHLRVFDKQISDQAVATLLNMMIKYGEYGTVESRVNAKTVHGTFIKRIFKRIFPMVIRPQGKIKIKFIHVTKEILIYPFRLIGYWIKFVFKDHKYIKNVLKNHSSLDEKQKEELLFMYKEIK